MKKPTMAFVGAGWTALALFASTYVVALWRMNVPPVENYFYATVMAFGLFGVISVVKSVRDKEEGIAVSGTFYGLSWVAAIAPILLLAGYLLDQSALDELQRGLLFLTYTATIFAAVVVQKNHRDMIEYREWERAHSIPKASAE